MRVRLPLAVLAALWVLRLGAQPAPPEQPLPFSHKQHVALGLDCRDCHANADPGETMGLPPTAKCMACHVSIATGKPAIQKLKDYADRKEPIPWARVYQIPSYVSFSHRTHLESQTSCEMCHGPIPRRDALWREGNIAMGACMDCHRKRRAGIDCNLCHDDR